MKLTKEIDSIIDWLTEEDGGHAVGEGNIKCAVSDLRTLKQAFDNLACEAKHEKPQGIQWNKYPETKPKNVGDCLVLHKEEGLCVIWATPQDAFGLEGLRITHWAEINLPNQ